MEDRTRLAPDERRAQLLALGLTLFGSRSYEDVSIEDIAREAGVSKGLMYHYFGNKRGFYTEVVRFGARQLLRAAIPPDGLSPPDALRRGLHTYFAFVAERADAYLALMHGGLGVDAQVQPVLEEARQTVVAHILRVGQVQSATALPAILVRGWVGSVEATALAWLAEPGVPADQLVEMLADTLLVQLYLARRHDRTVRASLGGLEGLGNLLRGWLPGGR
jgi:AcrR family transcriptional regulator